MTYYVVKAYKDYHYPFLIENEDRRNDYGEAFDKSVVFKGTKEECENIVTPVNLKIVELEKELDYQKQARSIAENAVVDLTKENHELKTQIEKVKEKTVSLCEGCVRLPMLYKELEKEIKEK